MPIGRDKKRTIGKKTRRVTVNRKRKRKWDSRVRKEGLEAVASDLGVTPESLRACLTGESRFEAPKHMQVFSKPEIDNQLSVAGRMALAECWDYISKMKIEGTNSIRDPETIQEWVAAKTLHEVGLLEGDVPAPPKKDKTAS